MMGNGSDGTPDRVFLRDEGDVRRKFRVAASPLWINLVRLLGERWETPELGHRWAGMVLRSLSDLARLRCRPDGRPLPAGAVFRALTADITGLGETPLQVVEDCIARGLNGAALTDRTPAEVTGLIEAFLRCYAADYERGELTWVDELYATVRSGGPEASWTLELPDAMPGDGTVVLRIPAAALEAGGIWAGDRLLVEPRGGGLWLARAPRPDRDHP